MGWNTVYITGKADFREEVLEKLTSSDLEIMPGNTGGISGDTNLYHDLYWVDDKVSLRKIKEAIGSKMLFKYRLRFYSSLEAFVEAQHRVQQQRNMEFSAEERALLAEITAAYYREAS